MPETFLGVSSLVGSDSGAVSANSGGAPANSGGVSTSNGGSTSQNSVHPLAEKYQWMGQVSDPAIYELAEKKGWSNPAIIAENYRNLETLLGKKADAPIRPSDDAPSEEWNKYYDKLGRPKSPDEYKLPIPEVNGDPEFAKAVGNWFYEAGLDGRQANVIASKFNEYVTNIQKASDQEFMTQSRNDLVDLQQEYGAKFDDQMELGRRAVRLAMDKAGLKPEQLEGLEFAVGTKTFLKMFAAFGSMLSEASAPDGGGSAFEGTAEFAKSKIKALRSDEGFQQRYMSNNPDIRNAAIAELERWMKQAYGDAPVS